MIKTEVYKNNPHRFMHQWMIAELAMPGTVVSVRSTARKGQWNNMMITVIGEPSRVRSTHQRIKERLESDPSVTGGDRVGRKPRYLK